jgi:hypothetical protein
MIPTTHKTLIQKYTADWCGPCGAWGWDEFATLVSDAEAGTLNAVPVAVHTSSTTTVTLNCGTLGNNLISNLDSNMPYIPTFAVSSLNMAQSNTATVEAEVNAATSSPAEVNSGFLPTWSASSVSVQVKTRFFSAASGNYAVGVYMYEDGIVAYQNNQGSSASHHNVLRNTVGGTGMISSFGTVLSGSSFSSGTEVDKTYSITLNSAWTAAKLHMFTITWKKNGTKWDVANANDVASWPAAVGNVSTQLISGVYPNPANDVFTIAFGKPVQDCAISMFDITGKKIADLYNGNIGSNTVALRLVRPVGLPNGVYMLNINSQEGNQTLKLTLQ